MVRTRVKSSYYLTLVSREYGSSARSVRKSRSHTGLAKAVGGPKAGPILVQRVRPSFLPWRCQWSRRPAVSLP